MGIALQIASTDVLAFMKKKGGVYRQGQRVKNDHVGVTYLQKYDLVRQLESDDLVIMASLVTSESGSVIRVEYDVIDTYAVARAVEDANSLVKSLPAALYESFDNTWVSTTVGHIFQNTLATRLNMIKNPTEKSYPDLLWKLEDDRKRGIEVKTTIGLVGSPSLPARTTRLDRISGITIQAHHQKNTNVLMSIVDFDDRGIPEITAVLFADDLHTDDWTGDRDVSGTRNTNVNALTKSGLVKLSHGFIWAKTGEHLEKYGKLLNKKGR